MVKQKRDVAEAVISKNVANKRREIELQINNDTYAPDEFDIFLLLQSYNIPAIIKMKGKLKTALNSNISILSTLSGGEQECYVLIISKEKIKIL